MRFFVSLVLTGLVSIVLPGLALADGESGGTSIACDGQCEAGQKLVSVVNGESSASCYCVADSGGTMDDIPIPSTPETPTDGLSRDPND